MTKGHEDVVATDAPVPPEHAAPPEAQIASLRRRSIAWTVDYAIAGGVFYTIEQFAADAFWSSGSATMWTAAPTLATPHSLLAFSFAIQLISAIAFLLLVGLTSSRTGRWRGQTPGKRLAGLRVVHADGSPIARRHAWRRAVLILLTFGFWAYPVGLLLDVALNTAPIATAVCVIIACAVWVASIWPALRSTDRRLMHDRLAGTVVVRTAKRTAAVVISADGARPTEGVNPADPDAPVAVQPLPRRASTIVYGALTVLSTVGFAVAAGAWIAVQPSRDEYRTTVDAPGAAEARRTVTRAEKAYADCIGGLLTLPDECDSARELDLEWLSARSSGTPEPGRLRVRLTTELGFGDIASDVVILRSDSRTGQRWESRMDEVGQATRTCSLLSGKTCPGIPPLGW